MAGGPKIHLWSNGSDLLLPNQSGSDVQALTDGQRVLYLNAGITAAEPLMLYDPAGGGGTIYSTPLGALEPHVSYEITPGGVAWVDPGSQHESIAAMADNGTTIYSLLGRLTLVPPGQSGADIAASLGPVLAREGEFIKVLGDVAVTVSP